MAKYVDVKQTGNRDNLTVAINNSNEIVIERDCNEYHQPYVVIGIDSWDNLKAVIDQQIKVKHENED